MARSRLVCVAGHAASRSPGLRSFCSRLTACSFVTASGAWTPGSKWFAISTLANYLHLLHTPLYLTVILRSMRIAFSVVLLSLLIGYPLACFLVFQAGKYRRILYQAVIIPLWISYLVRAYAWKVIFGNEGVMNTLLLWCHATRHPLGFLLYSPFAVIVTLTHIYVPFVVLPVVASLEKIPP